MLTLYQDLTMTHCIIKKHPESQLLLLPLYIYSKLDYTFFIRTFTTTKQAAVIFLYLVSIP